MPDAYSQPDLSAEAKDKLALYLATLPPDPASEKRSSNILYQDLVKNVRIYSAILVTQDAILLTCFAEISPPLGRELRLENVQKPILQEQEIL